MKKTIYWVLTYTQMALAVAIAVFLGMWVNDFITKHQSIPFKNEVSYHDLLLHIRLIFAAVGVSVLCFLNSPPSRVHETNVRTAIVIVILAIATLVCRKMGVYVSHDELLYHAALR